MSTVKKTQQVADQYRKIRRIVSIITSLSSPYLAVILGIILIVFLIVLLVFIPFLLFADQDKLLSSSNDGYHWSVPTMLDSDGTAYVWPAPSISRISSSFGTRDLFGTIRNHNGIDIADGAEKTGNQPIYSIAAGTVTLAGAASGYGQAIYIDHGNGLVSIYGHLSTEMMVSVGDTVSKGQLIGRIGAGIVGRSTGAHLHFQINLNGTPVNPLGYVQPPDSAVPVEISYRKLNIDYVYQFLKDRGSALADKEILEMIDQAGKKKNVDPHLLIAITGQEQSFVPKKNNHADKIIKNPWNVFGCWCSGKGATLTTEESASIAASTIVKLSANRPTGRDPIEWLSALDNPKGYYAEHRGWWIGVSKFWRALLGGDG